MSAMRIQMAVRSRRYRARVIRTAVALLGVFAGLLFLAYPAEATHSGTYPETMHDVYVTGFSWYDNTPPGSATIAFPVSDGWMTKHNTADGVGTYDDPITVAVGYHSDGRLGSAEHLIDRPGRRFYSPWMDKYFMVEDLCGDQSPPESGPCWRDYPPEAGIWIDLWVDGRAHDRSVSDACMNRITGVYANQGIVFRPNRGLPVRQGSITQACLTYIN